jgi:serine/threonine protein kinase
MLSPGTSISHHRLAEKIGTGGIGVVYKSQDTRLGRTVALKFLPPQLICDAEVKTRFEHEAKAASALNHANITTVYEIDEAEGQCFICFIVTVAGTLGYSASQPVVALRSGVSWLVNQVLDVLSVELCLRKTLSSLKQGTCAEP